MPERHGSASQPPPVLARRTARSQSLLIIALVTFAGCSGATHWLHEAMKVTTPPTFLSLRNPAGRPERIVLAEPPIELIERPLTTVDRLRAAGPQWTSIGESVAGQPIEATVVGSGHRRVLMIGGIHGDEPEGLAAMQWFAEELWTNPVRVRDNTVLLVRNLNPDGTDAKTRSNKNGVDLNRNFPAKNWDSAVRNPRFNPGPYPESEPETRVAVQLIKEFAPERILVMHATSGPAMNNYDGPGRELARQLSQFNKYPVSETIGYPTPGSLGNWAGNDLNIPIITLEFPRKISPDRAWETNKAALYQMLVWPTSDAGVPSPPTQPATR